jgi:hypothetical protein
MTPQDLARFVMRLVLPFRERERRNALKGALETLAVQTERSAGRNLDASTVILNAALFFLIAERDIQAAKIDALTHPDQWHRSLAARVILLTIHGRDMDKVAGQKLRKALDTIKASEPLKVAAIDSLRIMRKVQKKVESEYDFLRNATIAHRDADALAQYRAITQLDERKVLHLAADFYTATESLVATLTQVIEQSGTLSSVLAQLSEHEAKKESV